MIKVYQVLNLLWKASIAVARQFDFLEIKNNKIKNLTLQSYRKNRDCKYTHVYSQPLGVLFTSHVTRIQT